MNQLFDDEQLPVANIEAVWQDCLEDLQFLISEQDLIRYVRPLKIELDTKSRVLTLLAPNAMLVRKIQADCLAQIKECVLSRAAGQVLEVEVGLLTIKKEKTQAKPKSDKSIEGRPLNESEQLNEQFTFEGFVKGKSNAYAYAACYELSKKDYDYKYGPIFIYGSSGLGKTHLAQAIAHRYRKYGKSFCYFTKDHFFNQALKAFRANDIGAFIKEISKADLLIIDDVHLFDSGAAPKVSQLVVDLFENFVKAKKKQVIMISDRPSTQLKGFNERYLSRFSGGLSLPIEPPDIEMRVQILDKKAALMSLELPKECALFMAQNLPPDVRGLEGALKQVDMFAKMQGVEVSLPLVRTALKDSIAARARALNAENIRDVVAGYYDVSPKDLMSKKRSRNIARPRQMAMALIRDLTSDSFPDIGQVFGGRDHTTVMHACEKIKELQKTDPKIDKDYQSLKMMLEFS